MPSPYADPPLDCDIVMKGGITSGVVYPGAVIPLALRYRFRSIGGASAGAIAAAVVAAAEHARKRGGFEKVEELPGELAGPENGKPLMLQLFRPDSGTRPLFHALLGFLEPGALRKGFKVAAAFPRPLAATAAVAAVALLAGRPWAGVAAAPWIYLGGLGLELHRSVRAVAGNDFGVCRLGPQRGRPQALTEWLHTRIQETAGRGKDAPVLSFAALWGAEDPAENASAEELERRRKRVMELSRDPDSRAVDLQMMTTDLTHGRPWRLPVPYNAHEPWLDEGGELLFDPGELRTFFPDDVVDHLERFGNPVSDKTRALLKKHAPGRTLRHFPIGPDLPVVVAARMSLSFPLLISAVPLYALEWAAGDRVHFRRVLFSDGGITSNFPVHFFDSPLPTRPTFGLHLTGFPKGDGPHPDHPSRSVTGPVAPNEQAVQETREIKSLGAFGIAIKDAMQNWRDNAQAALPGFRERVVHIRMARGEGGLNLTMDRKKTLELSARGCCGGEALVAAYADAPRPLSPTDHWNSSRFARYRTTMALLERLLRSYDRGYGQQADPVTIPYPARVEAGSWIRPYQFESGAQLQTAEATTTSYRGLVEEWGAEPRLDDRAIPRPPSALRAVPPV